MSWKSKASSKSCRKDLFSWTLRSRTVCSSGVSCFSFSGLLVYSARRVVGGAGLPEDLAEDAEEEIGVRGGETEAADEAADFFVGGCGGAALWGAGGKRFEIAAGAEGVEQDRGDALEFGGGGRGALFRWRRRMEIASKFVKADGYGLAEVHGAMLFAGGDTEEPVAMAEIFVGEAALFRAEQKGDAAGNKALADQRRGVFEAFDRMLRVAAANGGGADDEVAVRDGFGESLELFGAGEKRRGAHSRACFTESQFVGVYDAKMKEAEVAYGTSGSADVERIARVDKDDAQVIELGMGGQGTPSILRRAGEKGEYNSDERWQNERRGRERGAAKRRPRRGDDGRKEENEREPWFRRTWHDSRQRLDGLWTDWCCRSACLSCDGDRAGAGTGAVD